MEEEQVVGTATEPTEDATAVETPPAVESAEAPAAPPDWRTQIADVDADEIRRHPKVAGIVGSMLEREREAMTQRIEAAQKEKVATAERERLKELRRNDPVAYAEEMEAKESEDEKAAAEVAQQQKAGAAIGTAIQMIPEWREIATDQAAQERIAQAVGAKANAGYHEQVAAFNATTIDLVVERRAATKAQELYQSRIAEERKAMEIEITARLNKSGAAPDMARANGVPASKLDTLPPGDEYNREYERVMLRR